MPTRPGFRSSFVVAALCVAVSAGCGGGSGGASVPTTPTTPGPTPSPTPLPAPAGASAVVAMAIPAASGGTVAVADGSGVSLSPNALAQDSVVQVATIPNAFEAPPSANFTAVGPALHLALYAAGSPTHSHVRAPRDLAQITVTYSLAIPADVAAGLNAASTRRQPQTGGAPPQDFILPIARIYDGLDRSRYFDVSPQYSLNPTRTIITAIITGNASALAAGAIVEFFLVKATNGNPACGLQGYFSPGLRYYDPALRAWTSGAPPSRGTHVLLLVHGILSCVEGSFNPGLVERYRADGAYDLIVGYDYDWMQSPETIGPEIAGAVNGLGVDKIDIFAHSYGTVNAMATVPLLSVSTIDNAVFYAGPLNGAYLDDPVVFQSLIAKVPTALGRAFASVPVGTLQAATAIYRPNNARLASIRSAFVSSNKVAHVIKVVGTVPLSIGGQHTFAELYTKVTGLPTSVSDGIVSVTSGEDLNVYGTQPKATLGPADTINARTVQQEFAATHTSLLGDATTQLTTEQFVAPNLSFEFDNANGFGGVYPDSGAAVVMKGIGTRTHFYPFQAYSSVTYRVNSLTGSGLTYAPASVPVSGGTSSVPITFTVVSSPTTPIATSNGSAIPTATATFAFVDANGGQVLRKGDFFLMPDCVSCTSTQSLHWSAPFSAERRPNAAGVTGPAMGSEQRPRQK